MAISDEITRLQQAKADIKTAIEGKGVTVSSSTKLDGYASLINSISGSNGETSDTNNFAYFDYESLIPTNNFIVNGNCVFEVRGEGETIWQDVFSTTNVTSTGYYYYRVKVLTPYYDGGGLSFHISGNSVSYIYDPEVGATLLDGFTITTI